MDMESDAQEGQKELCFAEDQEELHHRKLRCFAYLRIKRTTPLMKFLLMR